jgi:hypothetical protein
MQKDRVRSHWRAATAPWTTHTGQGGHMNNIQHPLSRDVTMKGTPSTYAALWLQGRNVSPIAERDIKDTLQQWCSTRGTRTPRGTRKHLTSIEAKRKNRLNLELALILALMNILPWFDLLACQKQAQSSHWQVRTTLIDKIFNHIYVFC